MIEKSNWVPFVSKHPRNRLVLTVKLNLRDEMVRVSIPQVQYKDGEIAGAVEDQRQVTAERTLGKVLR